MQAENPIFNALLFIGMNFTGAPAHATPAPASKNPIVLPAKLADGATPAGRTLARKSPRKKVSPAIPPR